MNWRISNDTLRVRLSTQDVDALNLHHEIAMVWRGEHPCSFRIQISRGEKEDLVWDSSSWRLSVDYERWVAMDKTPGNALEWITDNNSRLDGLRICIEIDVKQKR